MNEWNDLKRKVGIHSPLPLPYSQFSSQPKYYIVNSDNTQKLLVNSDNTKKLFINKGFLFSKAHSDTRTLVCLT